ncbi:hypothetical protein [Undibacterium fentianense]|uniref:Uncharacterized protein n=1 Tax=Undibacterium fentianense TaxID=2828728 RepID=A0A941E8L8_9BURK|nr:hypothetical protein [Undibacterium fentianense]MBR7800648.1 hypothetical protein [Undibacterium fentianense]
MKKLFHGKTELRQLIERLLTIVFGIICFVLIAHYWPDATNEQTANPNLRRVLIVMDGDKLIIRQTVYMSTRSTHQLV